MKRFAALLVLSLALVGAGGVASTANATPPPTNANLTVPISGTVTGVSNFVGTFTLQRFTTLNGQLAAVGTLQGTLTDLVTGVQQTVSQSITVPLAANGTCQILHLTLGPLDLNLLGLMVHLDRVVLDITAQSGPGNLLGNLLCGIAGLLDANAPASNLANILNQLLRLL